MLTKAGRSQSLPRNLGAPRSSLSQRLSLRLSDAPIGAAALASIVSGVLTIRLVALFSAQRIPVNRALSIVVLFLAPALLCVIYSLVFEKSKIYACIDLALAVIVLRMLPFTWYWMAVFGPFVCGFMVFCAMVLLLQPKRKP